MQRTSSFVWHKNILKDRARYLHRMQKALTKMNLLLHNVLSDNSPAAQAFKKIVPSISQRDTTLGTFYSTSKGIYGRRKGALLKRQEEREKKALSRLAMKYKMGLRPTNKSIED